MGTESLRTYNKIEPSSYSIKDRIIQIIGFSGLLLFLVVYAIKIINFNEYENDALIDDGSLIKATLYLAAFSFIVSILLGALIYYILKRINSNKISNWLFKLVNWFTFGLFVLIFFIQYRYFPEHYIFSAIYLIALTFAVKHVRGKMLKKMSIECEKQVLDAT